MRKTIVGVAALACVAVVSLAVAEWRTPPSAHLGAERTLAASNASNPTVALDGSGAGFVAWVSTKGSASDVYLARAEGGAPVRVNDVPGDAAPHEQAPAQVAAGRRGAVYVLWQNNREIAGRRFPASDLRLARSTDGGRTFAPAVTVNDDAKGVPSSHTFHDIRVAADGTVYVSWLDSRRRDAYREAHPSAVKPMAAMGHGAHGGHGAEPEDPNMPESEIRVARSTDGGRTFGASVVVDGGVCPCCRTSLAVGPDGSVYVAWRKVYEGDVRDVVVARMAPGAQGFGAPVRVHADGWVFPGCPHAGPSVAVDAHNRLHVAWYTGKEGRQGLWYARSDDAGRTFSSASPVLTAAWVPPSRATVAADGDDVWVTWDDRRTPDGALALARVDGTAPAASTRPAERGKSPSLAAAGDRVLLAWLDHGSVRVRESAAR